MSRRGSFTPALGLAACLVSCGHDTTTPPPGTSSVCSADSACSSGRVCVAGGCFPRLTSSVVLAAEMVPPPTSPLAPTDRPAVTLGPSAATLVLDGGRRLTGTLVAGDGGAVVGARLIARVPSAIPGRPEHVMVADTRNGAFTLTVSDGMMGRAARVSVQPQPPGDRIFPPVFTEVTLADAVMVPLPAPASLARLDGVLLTAVGAGAAGFSVRAVQNGDVVSTLAETGAQGTFRLAVAAAADPSDGITRVGLDVFAPPASGQPHLTVAPVAIDGMPSFGEIRLPPFARAAYFAYPVTGTDRTGQEAGLPAVTVRFRADLTGATARMGLDVGAAFLRQAESAPGNAPGDLPGHVTLALLPGTATSTRGYEVAAVPPPNAVAGVLCTTVSVTTGADTEASAPTGKALRLPTRALLQGHVTGSDGSAVAGVVVRADRGAVTAIAGCPADVVPPPATATTDRRGLYQLNLDAGTYRLTLEPPAGSAIPVFAEDAIAVAGDAVHDVRLPVAAVADGLAVSPDGGPVAGAAIRFYAVDCAGSSPCDPAVARATLVARGTSDAVGRFRVVVPAP